jgi:hypothetical protein
MLGNRIRDDYHKFNLLNKRGNPQVATPRGLSGQTYNYHGCFLFTDAFQVLRAIYCMFSSAGATCPPVLRQHDLVIYNYKGSRIGNQSNPIHSFHAPLFNRPTPPRDQGNAIPSLAHARTHSHSQQQEAQRAAL